MYFNDDHNDDDDDHDDDNDDDDYVDGDMMMAILPKYFILNVNLCPTFHYIIQTFTLHLMLYKQFIYSMTHCNFEPNSPIFEIAI